LLEHPEEAPSIVHHAVEQTRQLASASEARVVNAVLRRVAATLADVLAAKDAEASPAALARRFSHPEWLIERWLARFGAEATQQLLAWNQQPAPVHARIVAGSADASSGPESKDFDATFPEFFKLTRWPEFFLLDHPDWDVVERWLAAGRIYLQDPATAIAADLLDASPGETVLDVCASPGGKTLQLAEALAANESEGGARRPGALAARPYVEARRDVALHRSGNGRVVAVDLPGARLERLRENVGRYRSLAPRVSVVGHDATSLTGDALTALGLPAVFDAVLVDVPCSNTGVLRHRVEVKWRLRPEDFVELPRLQLGLLRRAAALVRPGGRLVYSTCSLEPEENEGVIAAFFAEAGGTPASFAAQEFAHSRPWETGCDGASAFLLRRNG